MNNHTFFQSSDDKHTEVLKDESNKPVNWLDKPTKEQVEEFEAKIEKYEQSAKKVRQDLVTLWIEEENNSFGDPVRRLNFLRKNGKTDVWPCYFCSSIGKSFCILKENI